MSILKLSMKQDLVDQNLPNNGILADILYVGDSNPKVRQDNSHRNVVIPVNDYGSDFEKNIDIPPGHYVIQATLPTGELISKDILIPDDGSEVVVNIQSELESPHEWLRWHNFLGNVQTQQSPPDFSRAPSPMDSLPSYDNYRRRRLRYRKLPEDLSVAAYSTSIEMPFDTGLNLNQLHATLMHDHHPALSGNKIWHTLNQIIDSNDDPQTIQQSLNGNSIDPSGRDNDFALYRLAAEGSLPLFAQPQNPVDYVGNDLERLYLMLSSANSLRLISLPIPWPQLDQTGEAVAEIMVPAHGADDVIDSNLAITDREVGSALGYLTAGDLISASKLFDRAEGMLFGKMTHPFAAVVGGYVMLKTSQKPGPWMDWVKNLMNWFDWLPDGAILFAWLKTDYQQSDADLQQAHDALLVAIDRGLPVCSLGISKLVELLRLFAADDPMCANHLKLIQPIAWRTDMGEPFTMLDLIRG
ncbi:MAG: hypothetical protein MI754_17290 [Chromatiales bacterium]|nr:hypothetical protein [Chromatiales bacterium]